MQISLRPRMTEKLRDQQELKYFIIWLYPSDKKELGRVQTESPWYVWEEFCYFAVDMMRFFMCFQLQAEECNLNSFFLCSAFAFAAAFNWQLIWQSFSDVTRFAKFPKLPRYLKSCLSCPAITFVPELSLLDCTDCQQFPSNQQN